MGRDVRWPTRPSTGFILLGIAAAKAGIRTRLRAGCLAATALIRLGLVSGNLLMSLVAFAGRAVALVPWGLALLRRR